MIPILESGDRFTTISREGRVLVWRVDDDGLCRVEPEAMRANFEPPTSPADPGRENFARDEGQS